MVEVRNPQCVETQWETFSAWEHIFDMAYGISDKQRVEVARALILAALESLGKIPNNNHIQ